MKSSVFFFYSLSVFATPSFARTAGTPEVQRNRWQSIHDDEHRQYQQHRDARILVPQLSTQAGTQYLADLARYPAPTIEE